MRVRVGCGTVGGREICVLRVTPSRVSDSAAAIDHAGSSGDGRQGSSACVMSLRSNTPTSSVSGVNDELLGGRPRLLHRPIYKRGIVSIQKAPVNGEQR
jgi:hypothetical protein